MNCCDAEDIKISNLIAVILRKFWIVLVVTIAFGIYGFSIVPHSNTYRSVLHINFQNHENQDITSSYLLKTYTIVMTGDQAMEDISDALVSSCDLKRVNKVFNVTDGKIVPHEIRICIAIDFSYEHQMLTVYATTSDPYISEKICNTLAENADRYISEIAPQGNVNIINRAEPYSESSMLPDVIKYLAMGFGISCAVLIAIDVIGKSVKDPNELIRIFSKPVLGKLKTRNLFGKDCSSLISDENVSADVLESYKTIRTELLYSLENSDKNIIAVSGVGTKKNNPLIAANIALAFAMTGKKTLLIDANLREPGLNNVFNIENNTGISSVISGNSELNDTIRHSVSENLDLILSGPIPDNPSEILSSDEFSSVLNTLDSLYDYIIISTPCLTDVGDALIIGKLAKNLILTVRYSRSKYPDIASAINQINALMIKMPGFIVEGFTDYKRLK